MGMRNNNYGRRCAGNVPYGQNYAQNSCPICSRSGGACRCGERRGDTRPGCGCQESDMPSRRECSRECQELMCRLQKLDFSIQETVLYLDAYPDCCEAKSYYHHLLQQRREVAEAYEKACGPLTAWGNQSTTNWDWCRAPWPWHADFPGNDNK